MYEMPVSEILINEEKRITGVKCKNGAIINAEKVILATGGKSYPLTGSTGDGYEMAKKLGHTITKIKPSLVPLETYEQDLHRSLQGLSLRNVKIKMVDTCKNKTIYEDFGEMLLIDLKPALTDEKLNDRILRDFEDFKNKNFKNSLDKLLPQKLIPVIIKRSGINPEKQVNSITKQERIQIVKLLKEFEVTIKNFRRIEDGIITAGGISIKEVNPKTMESKLILGLYFAGEILDVDSYTGGFNLQIAYSTGFVAGE